MGLVQSVDGFTLFFSNPFGLRFSVLFTSFMFEWRIIVVIYLKRSMGSLYFFIILL